MFSKHCQLISKSGSLIRSDPIETESTESVILIDSSLKVSSAFRLCAYDSSILRLSLFKYVVGCHLIWFTFAWSARDSSEELDCSLIFSIASVALLLRLKHGDLSDSGFMDCNSEDQHMRGAKYTLTSFGQKVSSVSLSFSYCLNDTSSSQYVTRVFT